MDIEPMVNIAVTYFNFSDVKDLQLKLAEIYRDSYKVDLFCYHDEGYLDQVDFSDIYVPIQWVTRKNTPGSTKETVLNEYHDVLRKVHCLK